MKIIIKLSDEFVSFKYNVKAKYIVDLLLVKRLIRKYT